MSAPVPRLTSGSDASDVLDIASPESAVEVATIKPPPGAPGGRVVGRSPGQLAWMRLRRDKVAMTAMWVLVFFLVVGVFADIIRMLYGYPTMNDARQGTDLLDGTGIPLGYLGGITFSSANSSGHFHIFGVEPSLGRDLFIQVIYGIRTSLLISFVSVTIATAFGVVMGIAAGYLGGWFDSIVNWVIDYMLAFPFFLFALAVIPVVNTHLTADNGSPSAGQRVLTIIVIFSAFACMGTARLVRGQVL